MVAASEIFENVIAPTMGVIMSNLMYGAPIQDLRKALRRGDLGELNPLPWSIMTGNCLGWVVYSYQVHDGYLLASNLPGFVFSLWLNMGAAKLQFVNNQNNKADFTHQEKCMMSLILIWAIIFICIGFVWPDSPSYIVGILVNINLIFFFGAPLQLIGTVIRQNSSACIHIPSMLMNIINTSFWLVYGAAQANFVIVVPNFIGLLLGLAQGALCVLYPRAAATVARRKTFAACDDDDEWTQSTQPDDDSLTQASERSLLNIIQSSRTATTTAYSATKTKGLQVV